MYSWGIFPDIQTGQGKAMYSLESSRAVLTLADQVISLLVIMPVIQTQAEPIMCFSDTGQVLVIPTATMSL